jgi:hypothetical protein
MGQIPDGIVGGFCRQGMHHIVMSRRFVYGFLFFTKFKERLD